MLCEWHLKAQALSARTKAKNTVFQFEHVTQMYRNRGIRYPIYFRDSDQPNLYILLYTDVFRKIPRSENSERRCPPFFKPIVPVPLSRSSRSRHPIEGSVTGLDGGDSEYRYNHPVLSSCPYLSSISFGRVSLIPWQSFVVLFPKINLQLETYARLALEYLEGATNQV
jgi:hypothetical protein